MLLMKGSEIFKISSNNNNNNNNSPVRCCTLTCWLIRKNVNYEVSTRPRIKKATQI